jgi:hypothetical protein
MARTLDELKEAVSSIEGGADLATDIEALVDAERKKGQDIKRKVDSEARSLREKVTQYAPIVESVKTRLGYEDGTDIAEWLDKIEPLIKAKPGDSSEDSEVKRELRKLQRELEAERTARTQSEQRAQEITEKQRKSTLRERLLDAMKTADGKPMFHGQDLLVGSLISDGRVRLSEDEKAVRFVDGEDELELTEGIQTLASQRKDLLISYQAGGAGTKGAGPEDRGSRPATDQERLERLRSRSRAY